MDIYVSGNCSDIKHIYWKSVLQKKGVHKCVTGYF